MKWVPYGIMLFEWFREKKRRNKSSNRIDLNTTFGLPLFHANTITITSGQHPNTDGSCYYVME